MYNYIRYFFDGLTNNEKLASITSAMLSWFFGGILLFDAPIYIYAIKGLMWLSTVFVGAIIPKVASTIYDKKFKNKVERLLKPKKDGTNKKDNRKAA